MSDPTIEETKFYVAKMDCPTEERLIRNRLERMNEVGAMRFDLMRRELVVEHQPRHADAVEDALEALGMRPKRLGAASDGNGPADASRAHGAQEAHSPSRWPKVLLGLAGVSAVAAEVIAWVSGNENSPSVIALAVLSMVSGGRETVKKGFIAVRNLTININFLMMLAIGGAVAIGQWPEAAMVTFLFAVAELIEAYSLDRARNVVRSLMNLTPEKALVLRGSEWVELTAGDVAVGDKVRVRPGERIPVDGKVISGKSSVNQAPITGESVPVQKGPGDLVFAGTVNELGAIDLEVTANKGNTTLDRIVLSVQAAQVERAPTQRFVDRFARYYTPAVVIVALTVALLPTLAFGAAFRPWFYKSLVLLVIACPCALVISTPVSVVSGLAAAAKRGILVKGGVYLEGARKLKAIALDKTGTVTTGRPIVTDVVSISGLPADEILRLAASVNALSDHPVARAVLAKHLGERASVTEFESILGRGVSASIAGVKYYLGSHRLAEERGVCSPAVETELGRLEAEGKTTMVLATEKQPHGVLAVADTPRETSIEAIAQMHARGVVTVMLTGDNERTARAIAKRVGIDDVRGGLMPEDKVTAIAELLSKHGEVGMVGDGINDAPALARSTIGFAMGVAGTDTAIEAADVALMQDDLRKLPELIALSERTGRVLKQNIVFAIGVKGVFFILAIFGFATLWMAVFADMGASLLVVFNGLRLLRGQSAEPDRDRNFDDGRRGRGRSA